jgi:Rod binding domain-containing protein
MTPTAIQSRLPLSFQAPQTPARSGTQFNQILDHASRNHETNGLRLAATQLVSSAFIVPALASMRSSPLAPKSGPLVPGTAEKRFAPLLDQHLADRITSAANFPIIESIVDRYSRAESPTS